MTFALNFMASELDARAYRVTNIAIHVACALLLFALVGRTLMLPRLRERFGNAAPDLAFAAAVLWVVHPLATDAVTYITQRTESLMALFYLLTLYASLRADHSKHLLAWQVIAVAACAGGMASKESMATAPLMVVLFDRIFLFDSLRDGFKAEMAPVSRPCAYVVDSGVSDGAWAAIELCGPLVRHRCVGLPSQSERHDRPLPAIGVLAL